MVIFPKTSSATSHTGNIQISAKYRVSQEVNETYDETDGRTDGGTETNGFLAPVDLTAPKVAAGKKKHNIF